MATPPPLDALVFKGTHNSYDPRRRVPPWDQVNDYGVWAVELDYMIPAPDLRRAHDQGLPQRVWDTKPQPALVIGHDGPGNAADDAGAVFGGPHFLLRDYLIALAATEAFRFRPLLVYLDRKEFFVPGPQPFSLTPLHDREFHDQPQRLAPVIERTFMDVFGQNRLFGPAALAAARGLFPPVQELAGQVIPISNQPEPAGEFLFHEGDSADERQSRLPVGPAGEGCDEPGFIASGTQDAPIAVYRLDNFSVNFSFSYAVPPNPLVVVPRTGPREVVGCDIFEQTTVTSPQGTRLLPFPTLAAAVDRARGLPGGKAASRHRRARLGFTVLATPGRYSEPLTIDFPLTIRGG
jgi:hypothetical protein